MLTKAVKKGDQGAILPIKTLYLNAILTGRKKWEYRKREIDASYFCFYETAPVMKVTAYADIDLLICGTPEEIWSATCMTAGLSKEEFDEYFKGNVIAYAYRLTNIHRMAGFKLKHFGVKRAPQSYVYIKGPASAYIYKGGE